MKIGLILTLLLVLATQAVGGELSDYEKRGRYFCSTGGTVGAVAKEGDFYMIIFLEAGPVTFVKKELSKELTNKMEKLILGKRAKVTCVHPAFRDDWQEVYDRDKHVWPKLLDILQTAD